MNGGDGMTEIQQQHVEACVADSAQCTKPGQQTPDPRQQSLQSCRDGESQEAGNLVTEIK